MRKSLAALVGVALALAACDERPAVLLNFRAPHCSPYMAFFDGDSDNISDRLKKRVEEWIDRRPCGLPIRHDLFYCVTGHTDKSGNEALNRRLSLKRAEAVAEYLIELGLPRENVIARGRGSTQLLVPTEGRDPQNRRVELSFSSNAADCKKP